MAKRVCGAPPPPRSALGAAAPRRARKGARLAGGLTKAAPPAKRRPRWAGAKARGGGCKTVYFCGKACQKEAWPGHKKECRRIVRERARVLDGIAADYAADEAMAAEER